MKKFFVPFVSLIFLLFLLVLPHTVVQANAMQVSFIGRLANFDGIVPSLWSKIAVDNDRTEAIVLNPRQRDVRIFNEAGMEIFAFGENIELAGATDIELGPDGDIYLVFPRQEENLLRLDYKGDPIAQIQLQGVPEEFLPFKPSFLQYLVGRIYLADANSMDVIITDIAGNFHQGFHLKQALMLLSDEFSGEPGEEVFQDPRRFEYLDMGGFCADRKGNLYFTISTLFSGFKQPAEGGKLQMFGTAGSGPGKFGVVSGITTDTLGRIFVADRLRSVVMIFDSNFEFITEFGYRGTRPGNLIVPDDVIVNDEKGLIYVAQAANRGVSVFRILED